MISKYLLFVFVSTSLLTLWGCNDDASQTDDPIKDNKAPTYSVFSDVLFSFDPATKFQSTEVSIRTSLNPTDEDTLFIDSYMSSSSELHFEIYVSNLNTLVNDSFYFDPYGAKHSVFATYFNAAHGAYEYYPSGGPLMYESRFYIDYFDLRTKKITARFYSSLTGQSDALNLVNGKISTQ